MKTQPLFIAVALLFLFGLLFSLYLFVTPEPQPRFIVGSDTEGELDGNSVRRQEQVAEPTQELAAASPALERADPVGSSLIVRVRGADDNAWTLDYLPLGSLSTEDRTQILIVATDHRQILDERGSRLTAPAAADSLSVPKVGEGYLLRAQAPGRVSRLREVEFDWNQLSGGIETVELDLEPFSDIEILVVDHRGRPAAGVPLIEKRDEEGAGALATFFSDELGLARLRVPLASATEEERRQRIIAFAGPHEPQVSIPFPAPGERATLKLPPTGSLVLRLLDERQQNLTDCVGGTLWNNSASARSGAVFNWSRPSEDGYLRFDWVGLNVDLGLGARPLDGSREPTSIFFPGPGQPEEVLYLDLSFSEPLAAVQGRLVDHQGQAVAGASLVIAARSLDDGEDWGAGEVVVTNEAGDFRQALGWLECDRPYELEIIASLNQNRVAGFEAPRARVRRNQGLRPGLNDLGVLLCLSPLPIAQGRLLDHQGQAVAGQLIELLPTRELAAYQRFPRRPIVTRTNDQGEFEFRSVDLLPFRLRLWGESLPLTEEILGGARDLTLIKREGGP